MYTHCKDSIGFLHILTMGRLMTDDHLPNMVGWKSGSKIWRFIAGKISGLNGEFSRKPCQRMPESSDYHREWPPAKE